MAASAGRPRNAGAWTTQTVLNPPLRLKASLGAGKRCVPTNPRPHRRDGRSLVASLPTRPGLPEHASLARRLLDGVRLHGQSSARRRLMLVPVSGETSLLPMEVSPALTHPRSENPSGNTHQEPRIIEGASRTPQRASGASEEKIDHAYGHCRGAAEASGGVRDVPGPKAPPVSPNTLPSLACRACMRITRRSIGRGWPAASHTTPRALRPSDPPCAA